MALPSFPDLAQTPDYVAQLQAIYGPSSQAGFGSGVFLETVDQTEKLEATALKIYCYFVGDLWERWGEAVWMTPWKLVYSRPVDAPRRVVAELRAIADHDAAVSISVVLDVENGAAALTAAFDEAVVTDLVVYTIGDGAAMSGILLAGRRKSGETTLLIFLLD